MSFQGRSMNPPGQNVAPPPHNPNMVSNGSNGRLNHEDKSGDPDGKQANYNGAKLNYQQQGSQIHTPSGMNSYPFQAPPPRIPPSTGVPSFPAHFQNGSNIRFQPRPEFQPKQQPTSNIPPPPSFVSSSKPPTNVQLNNSVLLNNNHPQSDPKSFSTHYDNKNSSNSMIHGMPPSSSTNLKGDLHEVESTRNTTTDNQPILSHPPTSFTGTAFKGAPTHQNNVPFQRNSSQQMNMLPPPPRGTTQEVQGNKISQQPSNRPLQQPHNIQQQGYLPPPPPQYNASNQVASQMAQGRPEMVSSTNLAPPPPPLGSTETVRQNGSQSSGQISQSQQAQPGPTRQRPSRANSNSRVDPNQIPRPDDRKLYSNQTRTYIEEEIFDIFRKRIAGRRREEKEQQQQQEQKGFYLRENSSFPNPPNSNGSYRRRPSSGNIAAFGRNPNDKFINPNINVSRSNNSVNINQDVDSNHGKRKSSLTTYNVTTINDNNNKVPSSLAPFKVIDGGNCSPRYLRSTLYQIPLNKELVTKTQLPFGLICSPFAHIPPYEDNVPRVPLTNPLDHPVRCQSCGAYVNNFVTWIDNGNKWVCNLCQQVNTTPSYYHSGLDSYGRRLDILQRPELLKASVDIEVGSWAIEEGRKPESPLYIFAIDVSPSAMTLGLTQRTIAVLLDILLKDIESEEANENYLNNVGGNFDIDGIEVLSRNGLPGGKKARIGIMTFDTRMYFYDVIPYIKRRSLENMSSGNSGEETEEIYLDEFPIYTVSDVHDPFSALAATSWITSERKAIITLLKLLPELIGIQGESNSGLVDASNNKSNSIANSQQLKNTGPGSSAGNENICLSAIAACADAIEECGGKIFCFSSDRPTKGYGSLRHRIDTRDYGTDREHGLYTYLGNKAAEANSIHGGGSKSSAQVHQQKLNEDRATGDTYFNFCERLSIKHIQVEMYLMTEKVLDFLDIGTLGRLCQVTGGKLRCFQFRQGKNEEEFLAFQQDIRHSLGGFMEELIDSSSYDEWSETYNKTSNKEYSKDNDQSLESAVSNLNIKSEEGEEEDEIEKEIRGNERYSRILREAKFMPGRNVANEVFVKLRCSLGLKCIDYYSPGAVRHEGEIHVPSLNSDTAFSVGICHDGDILKSKVNEGGKVYFQLAILYTGEDARRYVRLHNLSLPASEKMADIFKFADLDASVNHLTKVHAFESFQDPLESIRKRIGDQCIEILYHYRSNCAAESPNGQLILPESLKLLPLYTLCMLKSSMFRLNNVEAIRNGQLPSPTADERAFALQSAVFYDCELTSRILYPRLYHIRGFRSFRPFLGLSSALGDKTQNDNQKKTTDFDEGLDDSTFSGYLTTGLQDVPNVKNGFFLARRRKMFTTNMDDQTFLVPQESKDHQVVNEKQQDPYHILSSYTYIPDNHSDRDPATNDPVNGCLQLIRSFAPSSENIVGNYVSILDAGLTIYLYLPRDTPSFILLGLFGIDKIPMNSHTASFSLKLLEDEVIYPMAAAVRSIVNKLSLNRYPYPTFEITVGGSGANTEKRFTHLLVDDRTKTDFSYVEFLCTVHKAIFNKMKG